MFRSNAHLQDNDSQADYYTHDSSAEYLSDGGAVAPSDVLPPTFSGPPAFQAALWRLFDITLAVMILVFALPALLLIGLALFVSDPGPLFFVHRRLGYRARPFGCIKFRTMRINGPDILQRHLASNHAARLEWQRTQKLRNDPRVTAVGRLVRKYSLDEFPQLINVIKGDMSIVGPRPIIDEEVSRYGRSFEYYCAVRPGLTGLWQVSGRSDTTYKQRVELDVAYVLRKTIGFDLILIARTIPAVAFARGSC